jgi:transposase
MLLCMNRIFVLPSLSAEELLELQRLLRARSTPVGLHRRYHLIWELAAGYGIAEASRIARLHYTNAHKWVGRFQEEGLAGLRDKPRSGRPALYGHRVDSLVIKTATARPRDLNLGFTTWSLGKLEDHLRQQLPHSSISRETIRRILARHGLHFLTGQSWCESTDPDFEVKKTL